MTQKSSFMRFFIVLALTMIAYQQPVFAKRFVVGKDMSKIYFHPALDKYSLEVDNEEMISLATARDILKKLKSEIKDQTLINGVLAAEGSRVIEGTNEVTQFSKEKKKLSNYLLTASLFCGVFFELGAMNTPLVVIPVVNYFAKNEVQKIVERKTKAHKEQEVFGTTVESAKQDFEALSDEFYSE